MDTVSGLFSERSKQFNRLKRRWAAWPLMPSAWFTSPFTPTIFLPNIWTVFFSGPNNEQFKSVSGFTLKFQLKLIPIQLVLFPRSHANISLLKNFKSLQLLLQILPQILGPYNTYNTVYLLYKPVINLKSFPRNVRTNWYPWSICYQSNWTHNPHLTPIPTQTIYFPKIWRIEANNLESHIWKPFPIWVSHSQIQCAPAPAR